MIKILFRFFWDRYLALCRSFPALALPVPNDLGVTGKVWCHPAFFRHQWATDEDGVFVSVASMLRPGDTYLDIGANIGQTTIIGARSVGATGRVVAFEPSPANVEMMKYHLRWNRIPNVSVEAVCVGASDGMIDFTLIDGGLHSSNSMTFSHKASVSGFKGKLEVVKTPVVTIDRYCARTGVKPHLIKVDVEGAELDVLLGARQTLLETRPKMLLGVHPFWWPDGQPVGALEKLLRECGYVITTIQGVEESPDRFADYLCLPQETVK